MNKLQEITEGMSNDIKPCWDEIVWLIEQAEKVDELQEEISLLCPIADLPVIESLKTEKLVLMEQIEELVKEKQLLYGKLNMLRDLLDKEV